MRVSVSELTKTFVSKYETVRALDKVSFTSSQGQILTLLGPSGCGKTTLLRCIAGLEFPETGEIQIGEQVVWSAARRISLPPESRGIGMVFQSYAIWPHMNVFENVAYPLRLRKVPRQEVTRRVAETLRMVQLEGFKERPATKLSGGQQQRVALARALVAGPRVILFDEPLSNLDAKLRESTRLELRSFLKHLEISALYVTHDQVEALTISDEVAVMKDGVILERGTPEEIYFRADDPYVVSFVGRANFLDAELLSYQGQYASVSTPVGDLVCTAPPGLEAGTPVRMYARPESFQYVHPEQDPAENEITGTISTLLFAGEGYEVTVESGDTTILAKLGAEVDLREGDTVRIRVGRDWCRAVLPKGSS